MTGGPFATTTSIAQSGSPGEYTLTATVSSSNSAAVSPSGTVDFLDTSNSNYVLGSATLTPGPSVLRYAAPVSVNTYYGTQPQYSVTADFNQDGIPDIAVIDFNNPASDDSNSAIEIFLGNPDGTFTLHSTFDASGAGAVAIAAGDMNGDGYPDLVVTNDGALNVFLNNGSGGFGSPATYNLSYTDWASYFADQDPTAVAVGDVNNDGHLDVLLTFYQFDGTGTCQFCTEPPNQGFSGTVGVALGNGDGTLQIGGAAPYVPLYGTMNSNPGSIVLADLTGSGNLDAIVGSGAGNQLCVNLSNGDGTFQNTTGANCLATSSTYSGLIVSGDFNGDGKADLAISSGISGSDVGILIGNGDGTFQADSIPSYVGGNGVSGLVAADLNGDGIPDLATANNVDNTVTVMLGNGDGTFQAPLDLGSGNRSAQTALTFPAGNGPYSIQAGDFNGGGIPSLAVVDQNSNYVSLLAGSMSTSATATATGISPVGSASGLDSVEADYEGDSYYSTSTSAGTSLTPKPVPSTITVMSNNSTVTVGGTVTLTATVSYGPAQGHTPGGTATFYSNGTSIGTASASSGVAVLTPHLDVVQTDSITASYAGDSNFIGSSTSSAVSVTVQKAATTLSLQICSYTTTWVCPATTSNYGGQNQVTATLSPYNVTGGLSSDGETVTFYNHGTVYGTATLTAGSATLSLDQIPAGSYSFTASYPGDTSFIASSTSSAAAMTVAKVTPSVTLGVSPAPLPPSLTSISTYGQPVYLSAAFNTYPYNVAGETVTFYNGANVIGTATFDSNSNPAMLTLNNLPVGSYSYSASYPGDANWNSTNTNTAPTLTVQQLPTALTITSGAPSAVIYGTPITLQASLEPHNVSGGNSTNGESVTFFQNGTAVGTGTLSNGNTMFTVNLPPVGNDSFTASYAGDASFGSSTTSQADVFTVEKASTTMQITTNGVNGYIGSGQPITLTATVSTYPLSVASTNGDTVTFYQGSSSLGTGTLSNGVATFTILNGLAEGNYTFSASFGGDTNFNGSSTSPNASLTVLQSTTLTLTTSPVNFAALNQPVTITATLLPYTVGAHGTNNEPITLLNNGSATNLVNLSNGVAIFSFPNGLPQGSYSFTALYDGDGVLAGSTSATVAFSVATVENFVVDVNTDDGGSAGDCSPQSSTTHNSGDSACSLRDALLAAANAPEGANITFDTAAFSAPTTIALTNGTLTVPANTTLTAPTMGSGATLTNLVTVDGGGTSQYQTSSTVFTVTGTGTAISNLTISGGWTPWSYPNATNGGGILNSGGLTLTNCTLQNNGTFYNGGGIYNTGTLMVVGSTISGNLAAANAFGNGGGIDNGGGTLTVVNSTLANNNTPNGYGGGIEVEAGTATITNSTISANSAVGGGGGISTIISDGSGGTTNGGTVSLANSIVSQNSDFLSDISDGTVGYTDKGGNNVGFVNRTAPAVNNPNLLTLAPLGNYGGPTQTMLPLPGSSAICRGTLANSPNQWEPQSVQIDTDQRGFLNYTSSYRTLGGPALCVDAGSVQTNYTAVQIAQSSYTGMAGGAVTPASVVTVIENGLNQGGIPITLSYSGAGNLSGNSSTTVASAGASFPSLSVDSAGSGSLSATLDITPCVTTCTWAKLSAAANLTVLAPLQISPASETISAVGGAPLSQIFSVSGASGSYQLSNSGTLPLGLTLTPSGAGTGSSWTLSGSPTQDGSYNFTLTATDANHSIFTISQNYTITVAPPTVTTLVASPVSSAAFGQTVTLTATVSSPTATGTVSFFDGGNLLGSGGVSISGGSPNTATLALNTSTLGSPLAFGGHSFTAQYSGDAVDAASTSNTLNYNVASPNLVVNTTSDDNGSYPCTVLTSTTSNTTDGNNGGNPGLCTLRDALQTASAYGAGNIYFDTAVFAAASTISVDVTDYGSIYPPSNTTIFGLTSGSGATLTNLVTVDGGGAGGTIFIANAYSATINNLNINNGYAPGGSNGGAIINFGTLTVSGSSFTGNHASGSGGAIYNDEGTLTVMNSTFTGNSATGGYGGAIVNTAPDNFGFTTISNSTFYQNTASNGGSALGGALFNDSFSGGSLSVTNSTISGNNAESAGGGIFDNYSLDIANSIVSGNSNNSGADDIDDYYGYGGTFYWGSTGNNANAIGFYDGTPQNGTSANLAPFGNYGGPTQTMIPLPGSPAICLGLATGTTTDQRGNPTRPTGGYCPSGSVDAGSVQSNYAISFTTEPPASTAEFSPLSPAPVVGLTESGSVFTAANAGTANMTDNVFALGGATSAGFSSGSAIFSNLTISKVTADDQLTASLVLNPNLSPQVIVVTLPSTGVSATNASIAALTSPAAGAILTGPNATFTWTAVSGATSYNFRLGTTPGANDLYAHGGITGTSATVTNLPTNGETIYATLITNYPSIAGSAAYSAAYTFTASSEAALTSPAANSTFGGPNATFTWTAAPGATSYNFRLGTTPGANDIYAHGGITGTTATVNNLPTNGETIYATLYTNYPSISGSAAYSNAYTFTASSEAALASPAAGSVLNGLSQTFTWTAAPGATSYNFRLGTTPGANDIYAHGGITGTTATVTNLPVNGETIYATLYTNYPSISGSAAYSNAYTFTAGSIAALTSPTAGSAFTKRIVTFTWTAAPGATAYNFRLGTTPGGNDVYGKGQTTATTVTVSNLPVNGETIYATLYTDYGSIVASSAYSNAYIFTAKDYTP